MMSKNINDVTDICPCQEVQCKMVIWCANKYRLTIKPFFLAQGASTVNPPISDTPWSTLSEVLASEAGLSTTVEGSHHNRWKQCTLLICQVAIQSHSCKTCFLNGLSLSTPKAIQKINKGHPFSSLKAINDSIKFVIHYSALQTKIVILKIKYKSTTLNLVEGLNLKKSRRFKKTFKSTNRVFLLYWEKENKP